MLERFILSFVTFVGLIVPATFVLAPPVRPEPVQPPDCDRTLVDATQARIQSLGASAAPEICTATRLYFLEVAKARAVTSLCKSGAERERALGVSMPT